MFKTVHETTVYVKELRSLVKDLNDVTVVVAPPFTAVHAAAEAARNSNVAVSAQNMYWEREGAFTPQVFLLADSGYDTYSTTIETSWRLVEDDPDLVQRFVDASIEGWYGYLYGDPAPANALIKADNPDMTDEQIAYSIRKLKEYGIVDSREAEELGITSETVEDEVANSDNPVVQRLLGVTPADADPFESGLGLDPDWVVNVIGQVGNYGEIYERNLGAGTPFELLPMPASRHSSRRVEDRTSIATRTAEFFEDALDLDP